jgi:DNA-directed RNA polymerase specialized sigma24 family protein
LIPRVQTRWAESERPLDHADPRAAFDALFDAWFPRVYAFLRARVETEQEAEALTERLGIRLARRAEFPYPDDSALARCVLNELAALLRERRSAAADSPESGRVEWESG